MTEAKKKKRKVVFIVLGIVLFIVAFCFYIKWKWPINRTNYESYEQFVKSGALAYREIPEGATDVRYYHSNIKFWIESAYSFVISDDEAYDAFMEEVKDEVFDEYRCENPYWNEKWSIDAIYQYTEEELEEMEYLQENYMDMDYKEILSMSRHKYGFAAGYGAPVSDYIHVYQYGYSNGWEYKSEYQDFFPVHIGFEHVIDDDLAEYTILGFHPQDSIDYPWGVIVNEETRRFVIFNTVGL